MKQPQLQLADHLSGREIYERYRKTTQAVERTHWQVIYLKSQGLTTRQIAGVTGYSRGWVRRLIHRYNQRGPDRFGRPRAAAPGVVPVQAVRELAADNARKTEELGAARQVQRSMLASRIPDHPDLDIAVFMETASEVGGDYYDFHLADDGTLTVAVGDATGHGAQAGVVVTATKSLFTAMGHRPDLLALVRRFTQTLKSLNLPRLYMHLTLARYRDGRFDLVVAGMPPVLIYRAETGSVREVVLRGMPLGSFTDFPYQQCVLTLAPGDMVLLMSDGFLELRDPEGRMLESHRARACFEEVAGQPPEAVVAHLRKAARAWASGRPIDDDITFVVLRRTPDA